MLEECGLRLGRDWQVHAVNIGQGDQFQPEFLKISPNNKIPAIIDPNGPGGKPLALFESGAILVYLASKTGQLMPQDTAGRYETLQWVMWQMGGVGPMVGQLGFFHKFAGKDYEDKRPRDRYVAESKRLLGVLDKHLQGRDWVMGDSYTIADIAIFPWVRNLVGFYGAGDLVGFADFPEVARVLAAFVARPAVERRRWAHPPGCRKVAVNSSDAETSDASSFSIARQHIVDADKSIVGYELFNRMQGDRAHTLASDVSLVLNVMAQSSSKLVNGQADLFINATHESLTGSHWDFLVPQRTIIEVPPFPGHDAAGIEEARLKMMTLRKRGFRL
eukprot:gene17884-36547_t